MNLPKPCLQTPSDFWHSLPSQLLQGQDSPESCQKGPACVLSPPWFTWNDSQESKQLQSITTGYQKVFVSLWTGWKLQFTGSAGKNPPAMQETWVQSLGQEDTLEKEMATHSNIPAWEIPWAEEPGRPQSMGLQKSWTWLRDNKQHWKEATRRLSYKDEEWNEGPNPGRSHGSYQLPEACSSSQTCPLLYPSLGLVSSPRLFFPSAFLSAQVSRAE